MAISTDYQRQMMETLKQKQREEYEYKRMRDQMYDPYTDGFVQSGTGAAVVAQEPKKPQHLNPKLLLTKGA